MSAKLDGVAKIHATLLEDNVKDPFKVHLNFEIKIFGGGCKKNFHLFFREGRK